MRAEIIEIDRITKYKIWSDFDSRCFNARTEPYVGKHSTDKTSTGVVYLPMNFTEGCIIKQVFGSEKDVLKIGKIDAGASQWTVPLSLPIFDSKRRV